MGAHVPRSSASLGIRHSSEVCEVSDVLSSDKAASSPRIAFVHEWLITYAGSEKVLEVMLKEYPDADLFCLVDLLADRHRHMLGDRRPSTSFLQKLPFIKFYFRLLLMLMPIAIEQHDLSDYDIVISNSHAVAKGILPGSDQLHICYCYTPMRYAWNLHHQYLAEAGMHRGFRSFLARMVLHRMRVWDLRTSFSVDHFLACSAYISRRISKVYRRDAKVIYPNVDVDAFVPGSERGDFYITASRLTPYKRVNLIVDAFASMPDRRLVVIGAGPQLKQLRRIATPNVTLLGYQEFPVLLQHLQRAKAFIFAAEEDFGIAPIEAQACGTPVLAFAKGGASETILPGITGLFFHQQTPAAICKAVEAFEALPQPLSADAIRANALRFSAARFRREFRSFVDDSWARHQNALAASGSGAHRPADRLDAAAAAAQDIPWSRNR